jgi:hypothetical protein
MSCLSTGGTRFPGLDSGSATADNVCGQSLEQTGHALDTGISG